MTPKPKLIGSASSLEALRDLIIKRWGWNSVTLDLESGVVSSGKGPIEGLRETKARGRFRLEAVC